MRWVRRVSTVACGVLMACVALLGCLAQGPAQAATSVANSASAPEHPAASGGRSASKASAKAAPSPAQLSDPAKVLPSGWQHSSDEAVTVSGDATGLHVLAAREASGYAWRTVATLGDPAVQTDLWIGQACVTAGGAYAVVVYAPEQAANTAEEQGVLGRAAIVDLRTGAVKDLGGGFSIAYFDPGCGTGSTVVLTKGGWANDTSNGPMTTTLVLADAATGKVAATVKVAGTGDLGDPLPRADRRGRRPGPGGDQHLGQGTAAGGDRGGAVPADARGRREPWISDDGRPEVVDVWRLVGGHARQGSERGGRLGGAAADRRADLAGRPAGLEAGRPAQSVAAGGRARDRPALDHRDPGGDRRRGHGPGQGQHYDPASTAAGDGQHPAAGREARHRLVQGGRRGRPDARTGGRAGARVGQGGHHRPGPPGRYDAGVRRRRRCRPTGPARSRSTTRRSRPTSRRSSRWNGRPTRPSRGR